MKWRSVFTLEEAIKLFLYFGWLPRPDIEPAILQSIQSSGVSEGPIVASRESLQIGVELLRGAVRRSIRDTDRVVVPLSGGLDSRAVLAVVTELDVSLKTVSLGSPGTYDFDFGAAVAKHVGVAHEGINLESHTFDLASLVSLAAELGDWVNITEVSYNIQIAQSQPPGTAILTGLYGDFVAGELSAQGGFTAGAALEDMRQNVNARLPPELASKLVDLASPMRLSQLSVYENLYLSMYHTCSLRPSVFDSTFGYRAPFSDPEWIEFMFSNPRLREGKRLYLDILNFGWPSIFSLATKNSYGASLQASRLTLSAARLRYRADSVLKRVAPPWLSAFLGPRYAENYVDASRLLRVNSSYRELALAALTSLADRDLEVAQTARDLRDSVAKGMTIRRPLRGMHPVQLLVDLEVNLQALECRTGPQLGR